MRELSLRLMLCVVAGIAFPARLPAADKVIYGVDDRMEYYRMPAALRPLADATVSIWRKENLLPDRASGVYRLNTVALGEVYSLCPGERFREQEIGAFCSGVLVGEDLVVTAGHCVNNEYDCGNLAFVFGYAAHSPLESGPREIMPGDVYFCSSIVKREAPVTGTTGSVDIAKTPDLALIKLDRKVADRKPVKINRSGRVVSGTKLFIAGHPFGLPFKYAPDGRVVGDIHPGEAYFRTDLDAFGGNSGSPVFNAETLTIEGIHSRGDPKVFIPGQAGCNVHVVKPQGIGGSAETSIYPLGAYIPQVEADPVEPLPPEQINIQEVKSESGYRATSR
jgi:hypothetical protein